MSESIREERKDANKISGSNENMEFDFKSIEVFFQRNLS